MSTHTQDLTENSKQIIDGKILTFQLSNESYGIPVLQVLEILRIPTITPVPKMPHFIKGVVNLRGKVVPVIDMREKFNLPIVHNPEKNCIVVVQVSTHDKTTHSIGLIVDSVEEVLHAKNLSLETTPDLNNKIKSDSIIGIAKLNDQPKTLLNIDKIINCLLPQPSNLDSHQE